MDPLLVDLEKKPDDSGLVNEVFRIVHTIKGSAGFLQFNKLKGLCHAAEGLLAQVRSKKLQLSVALMDIILQAVDKMKEAGVKITENRNEEGFDAGPVVSLLESLSSIENRQLTIEKKAPATGLQSSIDNRQLVPNKPPAPSGWTWTS